MPDRPDASPVDLSSRGRVAPDFLVPVADGSLATFYECYCGRPAVVVFCPRGEDPALHAGLGERAPLVLVTPGSQAHPVRLPGATLVADDGSLARAFLGRATVDEAVAVVLNPTLTVAAVVASAAVAQVRQVLEAMREPPTLCAVSAAPLLMVPDVLSPALCQRLVAAHAADNFESGMLRDRNGRVELVPDPTAKRRRDHRLADPALVGAVTAALEERVLPAIARAFQYGVTRLESYKVVAYDASGGYFRLHRDNVTPDARHRRFALSLNLNAEYEGGELVFPEFGPTRYRPPAGGAMVFSGTLLHGVRDVTAGRRYVLLSFLWGDEPA